MRFAFWRRRHQQQEDLEEELRSHLEMAVSDRVERGESPAQAQTSARREFGNVGLIKDVTHDMWGWRRLENFWWDVRYGLRMLRKAPGFALVAVLTLAVGIGANSTVFSIVDGMYLRPLPVLDPARLAMISTNTKEATGFDLSSYPDYLDIRSQIPAFSSVLAYGQRGAFVSGAGRGEQVAIDVVSENYFTVLGVKAALGRTFSAQPDRMAEEAHAVTLSYALWQRRFAADPALPGKTVLVDGKGLTVLGIAPREFHGLEKGSPTDLWVTPGGWSTMLSGARVEFEGRRNRWFQLVARLRPDANLEQARSQLQALADRLSEVYPASNKAVGFRAVPMAERERQGVQSGLFLMAMVGLVLLIACANVASLLLAQTEQRQREIAVRLALGAGRRRLAAQLLTEGLLLAVTSGVVALLLSSWLIKLLPALTPVSVLQPGTDIRLDYRVLLFTGALSLLTVLFFGLAPGLQSSSFDLVSVLNGASPRFAAGRSPFRSALVAGEMALCVVLLVVSGLLLRSLSFSQRIGPGFDTSKNVLMFTMAPPELYGYKETQAAARYESMAARLRAFPGVLHASYARRPPLSGSERGETQDVFVPGTQSPFHNEHWSIRYNVVSPDFFSTVGAHLRQGREFTGFDSPTAPSAVIINEFLTQQFWPDEDPVGRVLHVGGKDYHIVGVVETGKYVDLHESPEPYLFFPMSQMFSSECMFFIETAGDPQSLAPAILRAAQAVDKDIPIVEATTLNEYMRGLLAEERASALLLTSLGVLGMFLAAVGLYAVVAYTVSRRTHEIGIRMALGARRTNILRLVLGQGLRLAAFGVGFGLFAAIAVSQVLSSRLYGVEPSDPLTYAASVGVIIGIALLASYFPAGRAANVDPLAALKYE
jgi:putative ABC transport system permease protein